MNSETFSQLQAELSTALEVFQGEYQNGKLEVKAQAVVDDIFRRRKARKQPVTLEQAGIAITGCKLAFDIGTIKVSKWLTAFWPSDPYSVMQTVPNAIPLGFVNGYQLYVMPRTDAPGFLVARYGMAHSFATWCPQLQGMPAGDSLFFVALERAKTLGYLHVLHHL